MTLTQYQVDAFTASRFGGNPAAVVPLDHWLDDTLMQAIAAENNLSETAFFVPEGKGYGLRWFTPVREVNLCGHATLATAHVLVTHLGVTAEPLRFFTRSGELQVRSVDAGLQMDFPAQPPQAVAGDAPAILAQALGLTPQAVLKAVDYLAVLETQTQVETLAPDLAQLRRLDGRGVIVTAPGDRVDFVSRFFAPKFGIDEDPVTGSAHCQLVPYWAERLGRATLSARQVSRRSGELTCQLAAERVLLTGQAVTFSEGRLYLDSLGSPKSE
ncbi:PhzF family phenazine biosynthesis protein [Marinimicrobium alkaliphilum]|uniref:PhzF family phenazine biosynthesis protein n=1 Tax=Marinimicrobium alkaliphilum TaxID=2202654 RepID=UPI000DB9BB2D|nr:PhzF family phenazine biosynthesis protein [Marinimicrobium alkaliphilum]